MFVAEAVDIVGAEGSCIVEDEAFEEGGAACDAEVGPLQGVLCEVVAERAVEAFEEGDFLGVVDGVAWRGDFHFKVVAEVERDAARATVGGAAIEALLENGIAVDIAGIIGVGLPPPEVGVAEVGAEIERYGGVEDVSQGFDRAVFEVEHAVDAGGEGGGDAEITVGSETSDGVNGEGAAEGVERFADGGPMPAFVVADGVGPIKVFKHFEGAAEGYGVLYAVLHTVESGLLEEVGVLSGDVVVGREGVGEGDILVPAIGTCRLFAAEGVESCGAEGE